MHAPTHPEVPQTSVFFWFWELGENPARVIVQLGNFPPKKKIALDFVWELGFADFLTFHNFLHKNRKNTRPAPINSSQRGLFIGADLVFFRFL